MTIPGLRINVALRVPMFEDMYKVQGKTMGTPFLTLYITFHILIDN